MKQEIKYIQIGLENVEVINIGIEDIEYMDLDVISDRDTIYKWGEKNIERWRYCQKLHICINKKVDKEYPTYGGTSDFTVFERLLKFNDIVDITYLDGNKNRVESIYVPWKDNASNEDENDNQLSKLDKDGNLEILIKEERYGDNI